MKIKLNRLLICVILTISCQSAFSQDNRDFYLWNTTGAKINLNQLYDLNVSAKIHYRLNEHFRDMTYLDLSLSRVMNKWLNLAVAFRGAQLPKSTGDVMEYRPQFATNLHFNAGKVKGKSTNRIEYRALSKGDNHFRYYHNFFLHFPSFAHLPKPYVGEELFVKLNSESIHLFRMYGGLHVLEQKSFRVDMYYVWQKSKSNEKWKGADVVGLNLYFSI